MANYNINVDLPGAKSVYTQQPAVVVGSSTVIAMLVVPLDPSAMQSTTDGYVTLDSNTEFDQAVFGAPVDVAQNEWVGQYLAVAFPAGEEVGLIVANTAAAQSAAVTVTVDVPFTAAPDANMVANVRKWEKLGLPSLHNSVQSFADKFIDKDSAGQFIWDNQVTAFYMINEYKRQGGAGLFWVLPVQTHLSDSGELAAKLAAPASDDTFKARALQALPKIELVVVSKDPNMPVALSGAEWATVDGAWIDYVEERRDDATEDDDLTRLMYVTDTPSASTSAAVTYRASTLNSTAEVAVLTHGQYKVANKLVTGSQARVNCAPAYAARMNAVSVTAPESWGHAVEGQAYTQVSHGGLVEKNLSPANRVTLMSNSINPLISKPGRGSWFESSTTQAKGPGEDLTEPFARVNVVLGVGKIWNSVQPILASVVSQPNSAIVRQGVAAQIDALMRQLRDQGRFNAYTLADTTSSVDITSGTARFELAVQFTPEIDFIELTLSASLGG